MVDMIEVVPSTSWQGSTSENVKAVCELVVRCFGVEQPCPIRVEHRPNEEPRALYERVHGTGQSQIRVSGGDELRWAQLAYQFAHEYCHILSNNRRPSHPTPWFWVQEALCEAASLFALRAMATQWVSDPPYPNWAEHAPRLAEYAKEQEQAVTVVPDGSSVPEWVGRRLEVLEADCYRREDNRVVAVHLLPYLEAKRDIAWQAVGYLNTWPDEGAVDSRMCFRYWKAAAPAHLQPFIVAVENMVLGSESEGA